MRQEIHRYAELTGHDHLLLLSIGCGTALPMLEVLQSLRRSGKDGHLILIDQDPIALAAAQLLAKQLGLADAVEIHCERLILGRGRSTRVLDLDHVLRGRLVDICEDSGLREYFPDFLYIELAAKAWAATKSGGLVVTGNMNNYRPSRSSCTA